VVAGEAMRFPHSDLGIENPSNCFYEVAERICAIAKTG